ncbi:hypothetical protein AALO_G00284310 [Alosa alosa]|uniref:Uncharacterized protein n=1 Tax=Alosa alosa TaxID=278164 RepID=A0AAV6FK33_9TELE|nr:hypothetical protein AALO_G00284310 [Alosa alosa]
MWWNLEQLTLPPVTGLLSLASPPVTGLLWSLLLLFLWYCYRLGSEPSPRGRSHTLPRQTSSPEPRPSMEANAPITMETSDGQGVESYLTPVLSHALFPVSASAGSRKLYEALQEYAKRYSWSGMARIHRGLRHQVCVALNCRGVLSVRPCCAAGAPTLHQFQRLPGSGSHQESVWAEPTGPLTHVSDVTWVLLRMARG